MSYNFVNVEINQAGLTVTSTDAANENLPTINSPGTPDKDGKQFYYKPIRMRESKWDLYCIKLGAALARELKKANRNIVIPNDVLTDLPKGYQLFEYVKNYTREPYKCRADTYLFGFGSIRFRSPAEFEDHLLWLASDRSTRCLCKYCSTTRKSLKAQSTSQRSNQKSQEGSHLATSSSTTTTTTPDQVVLDPQLKTQASNNVELPSTINHYVRAGEIVWIKTPLILSENYLEELRKGNLSIKYWPGYVIERQKLSQIVATGSIIDNTYYQVQPFNVSGTQKASKEQVIPWLILSSESLVEQIYKIRIDHTINQGTYSPTLIHIIDLFCSACDTVKKISKSYTPLDSYEYILPPLSLSNSNEMRLLQEIEKCTHYKALYFGSEILKVNDCIRMNDTESKGNDFRIFKINSIYKNFDDKILLNGDIYLKKSVKDDEIIWNRLNDADKEYLIELKEISGRYYNKYNDGMEVNETVNFEGMEAISFDIRKELMERQEISESEHSPSRPVVTKETVKHSIYFDNPSDIPPKKLKIQDLMNENTTFQQQILKQDNKQHINVD